MEKILFKVHIPREAGVGNTLKGFISGLSVHWNTKIECNYSSILGNFDTVLEKEHIFDSRVHSLKYQIEPFSSCRWLVLKNEESLQPDLPYEYSNYMDVDLNNPKFKYLFSTQSMIDHNYDVSKIHVQVKTRFLNTIKQIRFKNVLLEEVEKYSFDYENTLGISVRTWTASHEFNIRRKYDFNTYQTIITNVIEQSPNIHTVFISLDNDNVKSQYQTFLNEKYPNLKVIFYEEKEGFNHLQHVMIKMLALTKCKYFICNRISTFSELVFWFGECKQTVFPLY